MPKSDGGARNIINNQDSNRAASAKLPNWYHYGIVATFTIGIVIFIVMKGLYG
jgi:hypothetical protein